MRKWRSRILRMRSMRGRPPVLPIQYTKLSETSAPANPLSMTSGSAARSLLAKNPPANRPTPPDAGRPAVPAGRDQRERRLLVVGEEPAREQDDVPGGR